MPGHRVPSRSPGAMDGCLLKAFTLAADHGLVAQLLIAKNSILQERAGVLAVRAEALELDFEHDGVVGIALVVVHVMAAQHADRRAATIPFDAGERIDRAFVAQ